jgi:outer membrane protein TolC
VRQRPESRVAEARLHSANVQIGVAIANRLPQITLGANGGSTADTVGRLFLPGTRVWMIAGNAAQTVFDGRTLAYRQVAAEEAFINQTTEYKSVVLTAFQNVADVLVALCQALGGGWWNRPPAPSQSPAGPGDTGGVIKTVSR